MRYLGHDFIFFGFVLVALCLARLKRPLALLQAGAVVLAAIVTCHALGAVPRQLSATLLPGNFAKGASAARSEFLSTGDALPPGTLSLLEGHTVAVEPTEDSVLYAYPQLHWRPEPVLQGYSAYTAYLDKLNAAYLASPRALSTPASLGYSAPFAPVNVHRIELSGDGGKPA